MTPVLWLSQAQEHCCVAGATCLDSSDTADDSCTAAVADLDHTVRALIA
jgi:hypothetical protein